MWHVYRSLVIQGIKETLSHNITYQIEGNSVQIFFVKFIIRFNSHEKKLKSISENNNHE